MTEHTPTPWILDGTSVYYLDWDGESYEGRGKDYRQQLTNRFWCSMQGSSRRIPKEELEANAAFIVKAVNNHDALVKALEEIEDLGANGVTAARLGNIAHAALIAIRVRVERGEQP